MIWMWIISLPGLETGGGPIKMTETVVILGIILASLAGVTGIIHATKKDSLKALYSCYGDRFGIDPNLIRAIAIVESSEDPKAVNPSDPSYGLMQVLCQPNGRGGCANHLNINEWPPYSSEQLFDPEYNLLIAAQILKWNIRKYGLEKGVACYNCWESRYDPVRGPFRNQEYVTKVFAKYEQLKAGDDL